MFKLAFRLRQRLSALIDDVWRWETVDDTLQVVGMSRADTLRAFASRACVCGGAWRHFAEGLLSDNNVPAAELCSLVLRCLIHGRHESLPVVALMGKQGGEGKSFFFGPLRTIFGHRHVQTTPQPGAFPLLGLENKRLAILDEWDFDERTLPLSLQLLWFERKAFPITRPQNKDYSGHLLYEASAPVFITCKEKHLGPIVASGRRAEWTGEPSEHTMLLRRLRVFQFSTKLRIPVGMRVVECGACFAQLLQHHTGWQ